MGKIGTFLVVVAGVVAATYGALQYHRSVSQSEHYLEIAVDEASYPIKQILGVMSSEVSGDAWAKFLGKSDAEDDLPPSLATITFSIFNSGTTALLPEDVVSPLTVTANGAWRIDHIEVNPKRDTPFDIHWELREGTAVAAPFLINPGDSYYGSMMLSNGNLTGAEVDPSLKLSWEMRAPNLTVVVGPPRTPTLRFTFGNINVFLTDWGIACFLVSFIILNTLSLLSLRYAGIKSIGNGAQILLISLVSTLAVASSEVIASYVFPWTVNSTLAMDSINLVVALAYLLSLFIPIMIGRKRAGNKPM